MSETENTEGKTPAPQVKEPETFSREYVSELRGENKTYRHKASEEAERAKKSDEAAQAAIKAADEKVAQATQAANERIKRAELKAAALQAGIVDTDGLKLADLSKVTINEETGEVEGATELIEALKAAKPYLFGEVKSTSATKEPPNPKTPAAKSAAEMTDEEYAAEKRKFIGR